MEKRVITDAAVVEAIRGALPVASIDKAGLYPEGENGKFSSNTEGYHKIAHVPNKNQEHIALLCTYSISSAGSLVCDLVSFSRGYNDGTPDAYVVALARKTAKSNTFYYKNTGNGYDILVKSESGVSQNFELLLIHGFGGSKLEYEKMDENFSIEGVVQIERITSA